MKEKEKKMRNAAYYYWRYLVTINNTSQLSQVSLTLYLLGVKKELNGVNSATFHGVKRTFDCLRMRYKRKTIVLSEAVTPFYFMKLTPVYYLRNFIISFFSPKEGSFVYLHI